MFKEDKYKSGLLILLIFLSIFSIFFLHPGLSDDSYVYLDSMQVLKTGIEPAGFVPMKILSTYLGLRSIMFLSLFTRDILVSWLVLDSILYIVMGFFFFSLLKRIFREERTALLGTVLLATNYAAISFGLNYLMDIGGWAAYMASIYYAYRYMEAGDESRWIYVSSAIVGLGGLYKEYAFVACLVIAVAIIWKSYGNWKGILKKGSAAASLALAPAMLANVCGFYFFHYTYLDWFLYNQEAYVYQNRLVEFIKSFGSIYTFGWFLFAGGLYMLVRQSRRFFADKDPDRNTIFIWSVLFSSVVVLLWPVVTRVLFITMPGVILVSCIAIQKISRKYWLLIPILILYIISAYLMDSFILNFVNLPF